MFLLFNMLSLLVIAFLPRSKHLLISWLQSPSAVILEPKKIKSVAVLIVFPSICHKVMGPDAVIFVFWLLSFKPAFSLSSTFIRGLSSLWISFDEFVGEKVVSPSYSSTVLAPSSVDFFHTFFLFWLLWPGLSILCRIKVAGNCSLVMFLILEKMLSAFHRWVWCKPWACHLWPFLCLGMFPLYSLCWKF